MTYAKYKAVEVSTLRTPLTPCIFDDDSAEREALTHVIDQRRRVRALEEQLLKDLEFHGIIGKSPAMLEVFDFSRKVARHYTNVLLVGPTGAGKELVARAIHQISPVSQQRLAVCNCSAMVDTLLESQLFGHVRGAFTGATDTRPGLFEYANGGTVFLDEVGETSLAMQAKLLRVIQNREIQRVGSPEVKQVNVRLIAATNRDLRAEVLAGRFREDLFYRLSSIQIRIPSMVERLEDIPLLIQFLLKKYNDAYGKNIAGLTRRAQTILLQHPFPGNVREPENVISTACITATGDFIDIPDLPENLQHRSAPLAGDADWRPLCLDEVRKLHIQKVLQVRQSPSRRTDSRRRPHQPIPLSETRRRGTSQPIPFSRRQRERPIHTSSAYAPTFFAAFDVRQLSRP
jgi:transcriptional regulator with GAF, ATPase, and Fis domain